MLRATLVIHHSTLGMKDADANLRAAMNTMLGHDRRDEVLAASRLFGSQADIWQERICFGSFHEGFSLLAWRDAADQVQVHLEIAPQQRFDRTCEFAYGKVSSSLSVVKAKSNLKSVEVMDIEDTKPILIGRTDFLAHLIQWAIAAPIVVAILTALVLAIGGGLVWDDSRGYWLSALPAFGIGACAGAVLIYSWKYNKIRWYPFG